MQTASTTSVPPPPQNDYQPLSEAEIYAIKRQYLGLLPPQQIIDICLTFEAHAPLHVKSSVWPYDIRAAITSILAKKAQTSQESDAHPKTLRLDSSTENTARPQTNPPLQSTPTSTQPLTSTPATSHLTPTTAGPQYPHQPYYHPTYPHTSFYAPPHTTYGYPHPYPSYPHPPALYPVNSASHHLPPFTNAPLVHPPHPAPEVLPTLNNVDDLPSYEEMIVEALLDSGDPEGCAPKSLFGWMAMHYPLQMNFRPSASQALQKAYKRGRLEKGSNGKYRLNENWEGGNTSRRTTRRPQTLAQTTLPGPQPPPSPFTHTPLVPHGTTRPPPPGQPPGYGGYSFGYPYQGTPGSARDNLGTVPQKQAADVVDRETEEGSDAWEAAQNILKAINFGQLFQISTEENKAGGPSTFVHSITQQASAVGPDKPPFALGTVILEDSAGSRLGDIGHPAELNAEQRAALQAQLALLAAQLAEFADVGGDELSHNLGAYQRTTITSESGLGDEVDGEDNEDNEDMVEVPVPTQFLAAR